uniref:C-type lectin domain-containing protein n=1 Tax=Xiphophorus couchianus TaxID=32473 RepID=A0A3B5KQL4_9TELE
MWRLLDFWVILYYVYSYNHPVITLYNVFLLLLFVSNPAPQCDLASGWRQHGSNCYKFKFETMKSWSAARHDCVEEGGDLVSISSLEENTFQAPTGISLWMGGHDSITEGGWEWTDGSPFRYIRWNAGNPDDYFGEDCLSILINDGYWNDDNCQNKRGYICKRRGEECCLKCC